MQRQQHYYEVSLYNTTSWAVKLIASLAVYIIKIAAQYAVSALASIFRFFSFQMVQALLAVGQWLSQVVQSPVFHLAQNSNRPSSHYT